MTATTKNTATHVLSGPEILKTNETFEDEQQSNLERRDSNDTFDNPLQQQDPATRTDEQEAREGSTEQGDVETGER
eukprot:SAG11_NODE_17374_length_520_cov_1.429929_2_plen_76_part_00